VENRSRCELTGQFLCARAAVRQFLKTGVVDGVSWSAGKIICMSSVHQEIPWGGHVNYAASKGGIMMMMQSIAQEVAPHPVPLAEKLALCRTKTSPSRGRSGIADLRVPTNG
jgi:short-subunit dehydrogenase